MLIPVSDEKNRDFRLTIAFAMIVQGLVSVGTLGAAAPTDFEEY